MDGHARGGERIRLVSASAWVCAWAGLAIVTAGCRQTISRVQAPTTTESPAAATEYRQSISQLFRGTGQPKLQFVGDSILWMSSSVMNERFGSRYDVAINAGIGDDTVAQATTVAASAALDPKIVVVDLGTNDAVRLNHARPYSPRQTLAEVTGRFQQFSQAYPPGTCVVFVTVNTHNASWNPAGAKAINAYLVSHFAHIADWNAVWSPSYFDQRDSPHPNPKGRRALAAVIDRAVAACPP